MAAFPSLKWLRDGQKLANKDNELRKLGSCDTSMGIKVGNQTYRIVFAGFECESVQKIGVEELREVDFYVDMSRQAWQKFLDSLNGSTPITLNELDLTDGVVKSFDEAKRLRFLRYNRTLQTFFRIASAGTATNPHADL